LSARKVLTRQESQAQTRQEVLDAAEELFYKNGYQTTSIAAIAAEAGRTIGAVYSNFESKEALCLEVLRSRSTTEVAKLAAALMASDDTVDARIEAMGAWWAELGSDTEYFVLINEFLTGTLRNPAQLDDGAEIVERLVDSARVLIAESLPRGMVVAGSLLDDAARAVLSTLVGLAIGQIMRTVTSEQSVRLLTATIRLWLERLTRADTEPPTPQHPSVRREASSGPM
jgi:AcrR family transcriptional regulator